MVCDYEAVLWGGCCNEVMSMFEVIMTRVYSNLRECSQRGKEGYQGASHAGLPCWITLMGVSAVTLSDCSVTCYFLDYLNHKSLCLQFLVQQIKIYIYIFVLDCQILPFLASSPPYPVARLAAILMI